MLLPPLPLLTYLTFCSHLLQPKSTDSLSKTKANYHLSHVSQPNNYLPNTEMDSTTQLYVIILSVLGLLIFIVFAAWIARSMTRRYRASREGREDIGFV